MLNLAKNGRSTRTFITEGLWQRIMEPGRLGDYVFIQFGHNDDSKKKGAQIMAGLAIAGLKELKIGPSDLVLRP